MIDPPREWAWFCQDPPNISQKIQVKKLFTLTDVEKAVGFFIED